MQMFKIMGLLVTKNNIFKGFGHIGALQPSWSCDRDHIYKLMPSYHGGSTYNLALISHAVSEKKMFENNGHIHVYSPGAGADNHLGSKSFSKM